MKKSHIVVLLVLLVLGRAQAQERTDQLKETFIKIPNYRIGEMLPDMPIEKIIHGNQRSANTSDYKDRLLILDFWGLGCSNCIAIMPKMQALQKQFGDQVKILPITPDKEEEITALWNSNKTLKNLTIPSAVDAKNLSAYFLHLGDPHEVWVYKGRIIGITDFYYVDAYNINQVLSGKTPNWPVKNDFYLFDGKKEPLLALDAKINGKIPLKYSAIFKYKEKGGANAAGPFNGLDGIVRDTLQNTVRTYFINMPIYTAYYIYQTFAGNLKNLVKPISASANIVKWEVANRSKYINNSDDYLADWRRSNTICYESLRMDIGQTKQELARLTIADLNNLLGLNVRWEKRKEKVWVLYRTSKEDRFLKPESIPDERAVYVMSLSPRMNSISSNPYVFDETNYRGQGIMDIKIISWTDIPAIRTAILPYGLDLKQEERLVDKLIFTELNYKKN